MSYVMFLAIEALCGVILYFTYKGVFGIAVASLVVLVMLALSFHVIVRKPDGTGIRMACLTAGLWVAAIFSGNLFFEFRSVLITTGAFVVLLLTTVTAAAATYALAQRPAGLDLD